MDILAHSLWVGAGVAALHQRRPVKPRIVAAALALAVLPDLLHALPLLAWWLLGDGTLTALREYAVALPGQEPPMPDWVGWASHNLHCIGHSAVVAAGVSLLVWRLWPGAWIPLLAWWSHIVIDVFTHSAEFYPSPVLYPFTQRGFDGIAWNQPWFMLLNYASLAVVGLVLLWSARRKRRA